MVNAHVKSACACVQLTWPGGLQADGAAQTVNSTTITPVDHHHLACHVLYPCTQTCKLSCTKYASNDVTWISLEAMPCHVMSCHGKPHHTNMRPHTCSDVVRPCCGTLVPAALLHPVLSLQGRQQHRQRQRHLHLLLTLWAPHRLQLCLP